MSKTIIFFFLTLIFTTSCVTPPPPEEKPKDNLLDLVENQNLDRIRQIFGLDTDVNSVDAQGRSALHIAAAKDLSDIAAVLLARGSEVDKQDKNGKTPLQIAVENNSVKTIPLLIQFKASLFVKNAEGRSPITTALAQNPDLITLLVNADNANTRDPDGNTPLHLTAALGSEKLVNYLLSLPINLQDRNKAGLSSLDCALQFPKSLSHMQIAWTLVQKGAPRPVDTTLDYYWLVAKYQDANKVFDKGNTALHIAAIQGYTGIVQVLYLKGATSDAKDLAGNTPFHKAIEAGQLDCAALILIAGANINLQDFNNNTALHIAMTSKKPAEALNFLLEKGANPDLKNNFGNTPLHLAVTLNLDSQIVQTLINKNADVNSRNKLGDTPLVEAVRDKKKEDTAILFKAGANVFAVNNANESPTTLAVIYGPEILAWLFDKNNIATRDDNGNTALHIAADIGDYPLSVSYLLDQGANPNDRNKNGQSALHVSVLHKNLDLSLNLIKHGADIFLVDNQTHTPLYYVFQNPIEFQQQFFNPTTLELTDASKNTPIFYAVLSDATPAVQLLIQKGANVQAQNLIGSTPLHEAVRLDHAGSVESLLKAGANPATQDQFGNTPLHNLVFIDTTAIGDLLLKYSAPIEGKNKEGKTVLFEAARRGKIKLTTYLLGKGADPNTRDNSGKTPIFDALQTINPELVNLLVQNKAQVNVRDNTGTTPFHIVATLCRKDFVDLLIQQGADPFAENRTGASPVTEALNTGVEAWKVFFNSSNVNQQNNKGQTALHLGVLNQAPVASVSFLKALGADLEVRDKDGKTALEVAKDKQVTDWIQELSKAAP